MSRTADLHSAPRRSRRTVSELNLVPSPDVHTGEAAEQDYYQLRGAHSSLHPCPHPGLREATGKNAVCRIADTPATYLQTVLPPTITCVCQDAQRLVQTSFSTCLHVHIASCHGMPWYCSTPCCAPKAQLVQFAHGIPRIGEGRIAGSS